MRILGSDYDGTFAEGGIGEDKLLAVEKWRAAGNKFGIISGRGGDFLHELRAQHPRLVPDFYAACNGAYITDGEGAPIYEALCREVTVGTLLRELYVGSRIVYIKIAARCLLVVDDGAVHPEGEDTISYSDALRLDGFHCFSVCYPSIDTVAPAAARMRERYGAYLTPLPNGNWVDLVPRGVNKAEGLLRVAEHFGIPREDVIAVGDNGNDMDMIRAFRSYAMENGVCELRAAAGAIVGSVTELIMRELREQTNK